VGARRHSTEISRSRASTTRRDNCLRLSPFPATISATASVVFIQRASTRPPLFGDVGHYHARLKLKTTRDISYGFVERLFADSAPEAGFEIVLQRFDIAAILGGQPASFDACTPDLTDVPGGTRRMTTLQQSPIRPSRATSGAMLVCATLLFLGTAPGVAQNPVGLTVTVCSKNDPKFPPQSGLLVRLDDQFFIVNTSAGEMHFKRSDFENCQRASPPDAAACPAGQIAGASGCTCPASQTMSAGRCIAPPPLVVVTDAQRLAPCRNFEELTTQGSSTVGPGVMPSLIQGFANVNGFQVTRSDDDRNDVRLYQLRKPSPDAPCFRITVRSTGSDTAKDGITDKVAQIGMSSRDYSDGEIRVLAKAANLEPVERSQIEHVVARSTRSVSW